MNATNNNTGTDLPPQAIDELLKSVINNPDMQNLLAHPDLHARTPAVLKTMAALSNKIVSNTKTADSKDIETAASDAMKAQDTAAAPKKDTPSSASLYADAAHKLQTSASKTMADFMTTFHEINTGANNT